MPRVGPVPRDQLVRYLHDLGFEGPFRGTKHQITQRGEVTVRMPNPHRSDIGTGLLLHVLRQAGISREEWEAL